ncbi:hypothetical protein F0562_032823 [Nyssa sinensis]|uniref:RING-type domain-containing protein n=1 Tax=Nyssa sinensis TaxID=561372 RepID=A0A5J5AQB4_9ASTE|nr:hypothetical protein F0562_032823 [Nyssa sinensis]
MNHIILTATYLSSGWNFLFQLSNFWRAESDLQEFNGGEELGINRYEREGSEGTVECAVCLCKIEEEPDLPHNGGEELSISCYEREGSEGSVECVVCLCKIEEGDEIRELRCAHLFHRVFLDRWVGFRHQTCSPCRDFLAPRRVSELVEEVLLLVLFFQFK